MGAHTGLRGLQVPGAPSGPLRRARQQRPTSVVTQVSSPTAAESDVEATEAAMRAAKQSNGVHVQPLRVAIQAETDDLRSKFTKIQAEVSAYRALSVENGKLEDEVVRLRQEVESLSAQLAARQQEMKLAVEAARVEATGPLQQQLEELSMQLQNSQGQLERLGEAVEAAEQDKAAVVKQLEDEKEQMVKALQEEKDQAVKVLQDEKQQLLFALASAARRMSDTLFPKGSLPPGLSIATNIEGDVNLAAMEQQQQEQQAAAAAAAAAAAVAAAAAAQASAADAGSSSKQQQNGGFFAGLLRAVGVCVYHALGALLLYYSVSILRGVPPTLNLEFGIGCVIVTTLLPLVNRFLVPRRA